MSSPIGPAAAGVSTSAITDPTLAPGAPLASIGGLAGGTATGATATAPMARAGISGILAGAVPGGTAAVSSDDQPLELQAQLFRALLSDALPAREWASWSAHQAAGMLTTVLDSYNRAADDSNAEPGRPGADANRPHLPDPVVGSVVHNNVDIASLLASTQALSGATAAAQAPAAAADPEPTFAELIERHVRRTLATRATSRHDSDEVRLELTDAVLPDTSLSLRRSCAGWQLTAVTGDRGSLERLEQFTPALVKRFADASLGSLEVVARLESHAPVTAGAAETSS